MTKTRTQIPKKIKDAILKEYHHKCAFGHANPPAPELHHIDENPSNHDALNILPLCPNCHSSKLNPRILSLFRKYKKWEILSVEFELLLDKATAIFKRFGNDYYAYCHQDGKDLLAFVRNLEKGEYYADAIDDWIRAIPEPDQETPEGLEAFNRQRCEAIMGLLVELLPFQGWESRALPER